LNSYWDKVWEDKCPQAYAKYIDTNRDYTFIRYFKKNNIKNICDAACGFGKYSVISKINGLEINGFDVSRHSVKLTKETLELFNLQYNDYKVCSITDISFDNDYFDGTIAHSVLDHMSFNSAKKAILELKRITKPNGLIYMSFDGLEKEDLEAPHIICNGSFRYTEGKRKGMIFKHYNDEEIKELLKNEEIVLFNKFSNGVRDVIIKA